MVFHTMNPIDSWKKPCKISRIIILQRSGGSQRIWCEYRHSTRRRKNAKASGDRSIRIIRCWSTSELWFLDREVDVIIHTDLSVVGDCKGDEDVGSQEFIEEYSSESSGESGHHLWRGLTGRKQSREPRVRVRKIFNPKWRRDQSPRVKVRSKRS